MKNNKNNPKGTIYTNTAIGFEKLNEDVLKSQKDELLSIFPKNASDENEYVVVKSTVGSVHLCIACNSSDSVKKITLGDRSENSTSSIFLCLKCIKLVAIKADVI